MGSVPRLAGLKRQCSNAATAAWSNRAKPLDFIFVALTTEPSGFTHTRTSNSPSSPRRRDIAGYCGKGLSAYAAITSGGVTDNCAAGAGAEIATGLGSFNGDGEAL
jgi:hypothetical protein